MNKTPTPRTDEAVRLCKVTSSSFGPMVGADDMAKLERELSEAKEIIEGLRSDKDEIYKAAIAENERCILTAEERDQLRKVCDELAYCTSKLGWASSDEASVIRLATLSIESYNLLHHIMAKASDGKHTWSHGQPLEREAK